MRACLPKTLRESLLSGGVKVCSVGGLLGTVPDSLLGFGSSNPDTDPDTNPSTDPGKQPGRQPGQNPGGNPGTNPGQPRAMGMITTRSPRSALGLPAIPGQIARLPE